MKTIHFFTAFMALITVSLFTACEKKDVEKQDLIDETDKLEIVSESVDPNGVKDFVNSYNKKITRMQSAEHFNEILLDEYNLEKVFTTNKELYDGTVIETYLSNDYSKLLVVTKYLNGNANTIFELKMDGIDNENIYVSKYEPYNGTHDTYTIRLAALSENPLSAINYTKTRAFLGKNACDWAIYASGAAWVAGASLAAPSAGVGFLIGAGIGLGFDYMASKFCH